MELTTVICFVFMALVSAVWLRILYVFIRVEAMEKARKEAGMTPAKIADECERRLDNEFPTHSSIKFVRVNCEELQSDLRRYAAHMRQQSVLIFELSRLVREAMPMIDGPASNHEHLSPEQYEKICDWLVKAQKAMEEKP